MIPSDADPKLTIEFNKYNIETVTYDSSNNHDELWESIRLAQREMRTFSRQAPNKIENISGLKRFIATCYARLKISRQAEPLLEIIAQGIVAQLIFEADPEGIAKQELIQKLQEYFNMPSEELIHLVDVITEKLTEKGICFETDWNHLVCKPDSKKLFDNALKLLVQGVVDRLKVREGITAHSKQRASIEQIINDIFLSRGWDLGAHFAGSNLSSNFDAWAQIQNLLIDYSKRMSIPNTEATGNAILDLFRHPTEKESVLLTDIGRVAFGVELLLSNAQSATSDNLFLPKRIYLDANVLMPAIVEGHPYSPVYADTIRRLQKATESMGDEMHVLTAKEFLNEIVNHRRIAIQEVKSNDLENEDKLFRHILMYGRENTNVYISAYASLRNNKDGNLSFLDFLSRVAPYNTEEALSNYLEERGIKTIELLFNTSIEKETFREYSIELQNAYDDMLSSEVYPGEKGKAKVLIEHEAGQLARLMLDIKSGRKPMFVSADKRLFRLCKGPVLGQCASALISHLGLIQLVDLVVGIDTNKKALSHLIWDVGLSDERIAIRNYLIDLALQHYDEAKAMATWEIVDKISAKASEQAKAEGVNLFSKKEEDVVASAIFLDRFENDFYKNMAEVIKKREEET
ncbi:MAG: hypothetical protein JXB42_11015 [Deltaproteobacteria bacterium]|nr:hypothetical protein [Deltaproteobacteria bacterium]